MNLNEKEGEQYDFVSWMECTSGDNASTGGGFMTYVLPVDLQVGFYTKLKLYSYVMHRLHEACLMVCDVSRPNCASG